MRTSTSVSIKSSVHQKKLQ